MSDVTSPRALVLGPADGEVLDVLGAAITTKLCARDTAGAYELVEVAGPVGDGPPPHRHPWEETLIVVSGALEALVGDEWFHLVPGGVAHVPAGTTHTFRITAPDTRFLSVTSPSGAVGFFEDVDASVALPPSLEAVLAVAARHDVVPVLPG